MGEQGYLPPTFQKVIVPDRKRSSPSQKEESEHLLEVWVVFTSTSATAAALRTAGVLADSLNARIKLVVPQVVPFPLPLESPPVLLEFSEHRLRQIAVESPVETAVQIYLCRDAWETIRTALAPRSLVVIGGRTRWWRTGEESLARKLRRAGHEVIFAETE
jgi:hypothetical protein